MDAKIVLNWGQRTWIPADGMSTHGTIIHKFDQLLWYTLRRNAGLNRWKRHVSVPLWPGARNYVNKLRISHVWPDKGRCLRNWKLFAGPVTVQGFIPDDWRKQIDPLSAWVISTNLWTDNFPPPKAVSIPDASDKFRLRNRSTHCYLSCEKFVSRPVCKQLNTIIVT